jgi:protein O-mannosyl-transferase
VSDAPRLPLLLILAAALVWPASLAGPFQFDDWNIIVEQPAVHSLQAWWASMPGIRPLLKFGYALNWAAVPSAPAFHLVNLGLHGINIMLVWHLLQRWPGLDRLAVTWVTLAFALHPVQTEAVTYISGRSMSLMAVFWLLAMVLWLRGGQLSRWLAIACFLLAVAVRETALVLPLVLLAWRGLAGMQWRQAMRELRPLWLTAVVALVAMLALQRYRALLDTSLATRSPLDNLALQVDALRYLLTGPLFLLQNNIDPDLPSRAGFDAAWWGTALFFLAAAVAAFFWRRRHPGAVLALLWVALLLLPTNGPLARLDPVAERHLYLALLGPAVVVALGLRALVSVRAASALLIVGATVMALATANRIADYRSESALWESTLRLSPNKARAWNNLGYAYLVEGRPERAVKALRRALELDPDFMRARINLERAEAALNTRPPS